MKLKYLLKNKSSLRKGYIIVIVSLILIAIIGGSYALFTATSEGKGALNIVTGDLKPYFESEQLDSDNEIVLAPKEVKTVIVNLKNVNSIDAKYNFYYSVNNATADVEVNYLATGDEAPTTEGYIISKDATKTIKIRILNNHTEKVTVNFGSGVGLTNDTLDFPAGKNIIEKVESNIIKAYTYDQTNEATKCITGEEETCVETTCLTSADANSCPMGTIIRYAVNETDNKYFYVLEDKGTTLTMQQRENTVNSTAWYVEEAVDENGTSTTLSNNTKGPLTVLTKLEEATSGWTNVNDQTYAIGTTIFAGDNAYTACTGSTGTELTCNSNIYTLESRTAKARMITGQEVNKTGCKIYTESDTCPIWMYNYLNGSTEYGGTVDSSSDSDYSYWTMSVHSASTTSAWVIRRYAQLNVNETNSTETGARAVVEINK